MLDFLVITLFLRHAFPLEVFENLSSNTQGKMRPYKVGLWNGTGFSMVWGWDWNPQTPGDLSQRNCWRHPLYVDVCLGDKYCYFKCLFILFQYKLIYFNWMLITILYWFCHTSTCIRHRYTHVPHQGRNWNFWVIS